MEFSRRECGLSPLALESCRAGPRVSGLPHIRATFCFPAISSALPWSCMQAHSSSSAQKVCGVLFALVAILCATDLIMGSGHFGPPTGVAITSVVLLALLSAVTAIYFLRSERMRDAELCCRQCGLAGGLGDHAVTKPRPSLAAMLAGGVVFTLIIQHLPAQRFTCSGCQVVTYRRPYSSLLIMAWCGWVIFRVYVEITSPEIA